MSRTKPEYINCRPGYCNTPCHTPLTNGNVFGVINFKNTDTAWSGKFTRLCKEVISFEKTKQKHVILLTFVILCLSISVTMLTNWKLSVGVTLS